jgi:DNA-binding transcriptional LysR family regulator
VVEDSGLSLDEATVVVTGAARQLALSKSVVSDRLQGLERSLGTKLVQRTTRRVSLSADGGACYERAKRLAQGCAETFEG